jgi:hypothetical protein
MKLIGYKRKYEFADSISLSANISIATFNFYPPHIQSCYKPIYQNIQTSDSSVPVADNVEQSLKEINNVIIPKEIENVAGDGMKSKEEILSRLEDENEFHFYQSDKDSIIYPAMEQYKKNHSEVDWDEVKFEYTEYSQAQFDSGNDYLPLIEWLKKYFALTKIK